MTVAKPQTASRDILYYDGQCPLCQKEMAKLSSLMDDRLELIDIHLLNEQLNPEGSDTAPSKDTLLRVLHLKRDGHYLTGIDANIAAWEHTRFGYLWRWMRWPLIRPCVEWIYERWARWRYDKLYQ